MGKWKKKTPSIFFSFLFSLMEGGFVKEKKIKKDRKKKRRCEKEAEDAGNEKKK